jgi:hypothetical protein
MSDNYWNDYTLFIKRTEELTYISPAELIERDDEFIKGLADGYYYDDLGYEFDNDFYIRELIDRVISDIQLQNNQLLVDFNEKIKMLDINCKRFLIIDDQKKDWWKNVKINQDEIKKANP